MNVIGKDSDALPSHDKSEFFFFLFNEVADTPVLVTGVEEKESYRVLLLG